MADYNIGQRKKETLGQKTSLEGGGKSRKNDIPSLKNTQKQ